MEEILSLIRKYTGHDNIFLTARGNAAIWIALKTVALHKQGPILVQDQGGWKTFLEYPEKLGLNLVKIKTDYGVIDLKDLEEKAKDAAALIYENPAGYFAEQPFHEIYQICRKHGCLVVMDISGCISDELMYTADIADFFVCSFGKWKVTNAGYGGFISARSKEFVGKLKQALDAARLDNPEVFSFSADKKEQVSSALSRAPERLTNLYKEVGKVKYELDGFDIIHKDKMGIVVVVKYEDESIKQQLIDYCKRNGYEYTECPRYIRVTDNAISVEIKRLE